MRVALSVFLSLLFLTVAIADEKYEKEMKKNLEKLNDCKTPNDFIKLANNFERIAVAEKDKWLSYYYSAFVYVLASYVDSSNSRKDIYLDKSDKFNNIADSLEPNNSEIYTLKGMIAQARMQVDPMNRWQKYGADATKNFTKAIEIDTLNPRPEYLIGAGTFYTPTQFGGGPTVAKPILEKSLAKFEKFVPENEIMPNWGKEQVMDYLKQINEGK
jgi:hypothetical protein